MQNADHSQSFEILRSRSKVKTFQARLSRNSLEVLVLLLVVFLLAFIFFVPWLEVPWRRPLDYQKCAAQFDAICYVSAAFCFTCR